jgi:23S rRNA (cytosine1962-C5)-methyltransferase
MMLPLPASELLPATGVDYVLLDSGHGRKLERFGKIVVNRPEPQAVWAPALPEADWAAAMATFAPKTGDEDGDGGNWHNGGKVPERWPMAFGGPKGKVAFYARLTPFRHLGCFPDQSPQWAWLQEVLKPGQSVLNLFGYTGVASIVAAKAGALVTHVDASKKSLGYGRENAELAGLDTAAKAEGVRWMCDDALGFAEREVRRGKTYDVLLLDPPKYGRGPDGERWDFFADVPALLAACAPLVAPGGHVWLTSYALRASSVALVSALQAACGPAAALRHGELVTTDAAGRAFSSAFWAHWQKQA